MANKKRGRPPGKSAAKKSNNMKSGASGKTSQKNNNVKQPAGIRAEILGVIFIGIGIMLMICVVNENALGFVGGPISSVLRHSFGVGAILLPIALMGYGVYLIAKKDKVAFKIKLVLSIIVFLMIISLAHILAIDGGKYEGMKLYEYISYSWRMGEIKNGGLLGSLIGGLFLTLIGKVGTYILFIMTALVAFMAMSGKSIYNGILAISRIVKDMGAEWEEYEDDEYYEDEYEEELPKKTKKITRDDLISEPDVMTKELPKFKIEGKNKVKEQQTEKTKSDKPVKLDSHGRVMTVDIKKEHKNTPKISLITDEINKNKKSQSVENMLRDKANVRHNNPVPYINIPEDNIEEEFESEILAESVPYIDEYATEGIQEEEYRTEPQQNKDESAKEVGKELKTESIQPAITKVEDNPPWEEAVTYEEGQEPIIIEAEKTKTLDKLKIDAEAKKAEYKFPKLEFLGKNPNKGTNSSKQEMLRNSKLLEDTLSSFGVEAKVNNISKGPTVTRYELTPSVGTRVNKIVSLEDDIALSLAAKSIRIEAPIPGKSAVGIEIPNDEIMSVYLSEVIRNEKFQNFTSKTAFGLGKDITGNVIVTDISKMPHMLIAGATGSGKSVCINTLITSILYKATPDEVRLIMVDPKVVELSVYNGIPHLLIPVVTDPQKAAGALNWAVREMMRRYQLFSETGTRNLKGYNEKQKKEERLPQIVLIIDELADLMMVAKKEVEDSICRLAQLARAAGIHLIIATQRPSVDVITGLIKANIPSRIAFAVSSSTDSRTVLDVGGAEKLLGKGDMLFRSVDMSKPLRVQGAFVTDQEVETIVNYIKTETPNYDENVMEEITKAVTADDVGGESNSDSDVLTDDVIAFLVKKGKASTGMVQRQFRIGYNRAARIIDELEERGIIGPENGSKPREVYMDRYELRDRQERYEDY